MYFISIYCRTHKLNVILRNQSVRCVFIHIYDWGYEHANYTTDVFGGQFGCCCFFFANITQMVNATVVKLTR